MLLVQSFIAVLHVREDLPIIIIYSHSNPSFKDRVHCFSMQVVKNNCFLLNPEKIFV